MNHDCYRVIAHRGLFDPQNGLPENSLAAFENAVRCRAAIELDVRLAKDGQVVVFHDDNLFRMTGADREVSECTWAELKKLRLSGTDQQIPLFREVLELAGGKIPLLVELKEERFHTELVEKTCRLVSRCPGQYLMESFNPYQLLWLRRHAPEIPRGQLSCRDFPTVRLAPERYALRRMAFNGVTRPQFVAYEIHDLTVDLANRLHRQGIAVFGWTVRTARELVKAAALCDGVIFERLPLSQVRHPMRAPSPLK